MSRRRAALTFALATLAPLVVLAVGVSRRRSTEVVSWTVQPRWLWFAIAVAIVALVWRLAVLADLVRSERALRHGPVLRRVVALAVIVAVIAAPHALVIRYAAIQLDLLDTVFVAENVVTARPSAAVTTVPATTTTTTTAPTTTGAPPDDTAATTTTTAPTTTTTAPPRTWDGDRRLTIALLGSDGGFDRSGVRTDTIMALSIDVDDGDAVLFSVPRNWSMVPFPVGTPAAREWPDGYPLLINTVFALGDSHSWLFPDVEDRRGHSLKLALAEILGVPVHYYVLVDFSGVVETIDLFGGVDVTVTEFIDDSIKPITPGGPSLVIKVGPGDHHFDGMTALAYARSRNYSSDYHRMTRQRCIVEALVDQVGVVEALANYPALARIVGDHFTTDIPQARLPDLIDVMSLLDTSEIVTVNFIPPEFPRGAVRLDLTRAAVAEALARSDSGDGGEDLELGDDALDAACGQVSPS